MVFHILFANVQQTLVKKFILKNEKSVGKVIRDNFSLSIARYIPISIISFIRFQLAIKYRRIKILIVSINIILRAKMDDINVIFNS